MLHSMMMVFLYVIWLKRVNYFVDSENLGIRLLVKLKRHLAAVLGPRKGATRS